MIAPFFYPLIEEANAKTLSLFSGKTLCLGVLAFEKALDDIP